MASLLTQVKWTDASGSPVVLSDVSSIQVRRSEEIKNNSVDVKLRNVPYTARPYIQNDTVVFDPSEDLQVFAVYDTSSAVITHTDNRLFNGRIVEFEQKNSRNKQELVLDGSDSSFIVLNKLYVGEETGTAPELIKQVVDFVNDGVADVSKRVTANLTSSSGKIEALTPSGGTFQDFTLAKVFKPAYEAITDLSQPDATLQEKSYKFFIDKNNELNWFYPDDSASHVLKEGSTTPQAAVYLNPGTGTVKSFTDTNAHHIINFKLKKAVYDITNFIIFKAGLDLYDDQIMDFAYDETSGSPILKDSLRNYEDISRALKRAEAEVGNLTYNSADDYSIAVTSGTTSWGAAYSTGAEYNELFINKAVSLAKAKCQAVFDKTGSPRYKGTIELRGANFYDPTEKLVFISEQSGISCVARITEVQHNISKNGWFTTLTVEEELV